MESNKGFDPSQHLSRIKGQDYLEVKYRLQWFRSEYPRGSIHTTPIRIEDTFAVIQAEVTKVGEGGELLGVATGIGSETHAGFENYIEKAETKAIGRALAALGFGIQFAAEFDEEGALADAPVQRGKDNVVPMRSTGNGSQDATNGSQLGGRVMNPTAQPSDRQVDLIRTLAGERGITNLDVFATDIVGMTFSQINRGAASKLIDTLHGMARQQGSHSASKSLEMGGSRVAVQQVNDEMRAAVANWRRNIENARSAQGLDVIEKAIQEANLGDQPDLGRALAAKREAIGAPAF